MNSQNTEIFFDYFDEIADNLYRKYKIPYLEGMNEAFRLLLDGKMLNDYNEETIKDALILKRKIKDMSFEREEIRKAVQYGVLKAYKHTNESNASITPETIGIFIGYLVNKLPFKAKFKQILDPLCGTGNLLYTVANQISDNIIIHGIDINRTKCEISRNLGDLLDYENQMFHQDITTFYSLGYDVIVMDPSLTNEKAYMFISHSVNLLKEYGYLFTVIENDFFTKDSNRIFLKEIRNQAQIIGLIALPENLSNQKQKSILIIQKTKKQFKNTLVAQLPSFRDKDKMEEILFRINEWIQKRKDDLS